MGEHFVLPYAVIEGYEGLTIAVIESLAALPAPMGRPDFHISPGSGELQAVGVAVQELQLQGGTTDLPAAGGELTIESTSVEDAPGGTGLATVALRAVDGDFGNAGAGHFEPWATVPVTLAGTTPVVVSGSWSRALLMIGTGRGTGAIGRTSNIGTIDCKIDGNLQLRMGPGTGRGQTTRQFVPPGWMGVVSRFFLTWSASQPVHIRCAGQGGGYPTVFEGTFDRSIDVPITPEVIIGPTDASCFVDRPSGSGTTVDMQSSFAFVPVRK